jgi:hypothetical protein
MIALAAWARDRIVVVAGEMWVRRSSAVWTEFWTCPRLGVRVGLADSRWFADGFFVHDNTRDSSMAAALRWRGDRRSR